MTWLVLRVLDAISWGLWRAGPRRAIALGRVLGLFVFHVLRVRRRVVLDNLRHAFPEKSQAERVGIARDCYRQLGRILAETVIMGRLTPAQIDDLIRFDGDEKVRAALESGTGAIVCLGHIGNWEMMGFGAGRWGYPVWAITKTLKGAFNRRLVESRKKAFRELPPRDSFEQGLEVLMRSEILALIVDQHRGGPKAVVVDFFGRPAGTSPSPALFALRSGAPVFTAWMTLGPRDEYVVKVEGPVPVPEASTLDGRLVRHSQMIADSLEATVRERPGEWFWVHRRWKLETPTSEQDAAVSVAS